MFEKLPIRLQLVLFFVSLFGGLLITFSLGMYFYISHTRQDEFEAALHYCILHTARSLTQTQLDLRELPADFPQDVQVILPFSLGQALIQISSPTGEVLVRSQSLVRQSLPNPTVDFDTLIQKSSLTTEIVLTRPENGRGPNGTYRLVAKAFYRPDLGDFIVQAAVAKSLIEVPQKGLMIFLVLSVPLALALSAVGGMALSGKAMQPVAAITQKANEIEAHDLSERIPVPHGADEIQELALTLNKLLDRLEHAFRTQSTFIADASHQLKTPLAILKGELAVFRQSRRNEQELDEFLASSDQEIGHLGRVVEDLLLLARAESETSYETREVFRLDEKLMESVARYSRYAEKQEVSLAVDLHTENDGEFQATGDPELVRSMMDNLIENAIKYSPRGKTVFISLKETKQSFVLEVRDEGAGVSPDALPYIFDRFYRAESNRTSTSGSGLGLSIVQKIAEIHGGFVRASNSPQGGACFTVELPREPARDLLRLTLPLSLLPSE